VAGGRTAWRLILLPLSVEDIAEITRGWVVMVIVNGAFQHAIRKNVSKPAIGPTTPETDNQTTPVVSNTQAPSKEDKTPKKKLHTTSARLTGASKQDRSPARTWLNMAPPP
jgi:hypothetical protein